MSLLAGWYTTFLSSIIPEIKTSYAFAGTYPLFLKLFWNNKGDGEHFGSKIHEKIDYWDLYLLSTIDKFNKQNRKHFQVYNKNERISALIMKEVSDNLGSTNFKVESHDVDHHIIEPNFIFSQF